MAAENDILSGLDISSLSSVTQVQLIQMINQAAPLVNKGLILSQNTTPDVTNNPRYSRYIWLDSTTIPPTPKIYNSGTLAWDSLILSAGSISNSHINAAAAIAITKLAFGTARFIIRTNAAGNAVEYVNPNSIFTTNDVPLSALDSSAAPAGKSYLQRNASSGVTSFQAIAFADFAAGDLLAVNKLQTGTANYVLATVGGTAAWAQVETLFSQLDYTKITGASAGLQVLSRNAGNTANEWALPKFSREYSASSADTFNVDFPAVTSDKLAFAHGFATMPKLFRAVGVNISTELGFAVNDEVDAHAFYHTVAADEHGKPFFAVVADSTNITVISENTAGGFVFLLNKTPATGSAIDRTKWRIKVYAWV